MENSKRATLARALLASAGLCSIISLTSQAVAEEQQQQTSTISRRFLFDDEFGRLGGRMVSDS